jgi:hypothetical protein
VKGAGPPAPAATMEAAARRRAAPPAPPAATRRHGPPLGPSQAAASAPAALGPPPCATPRAHLVKTRQRQLLKLMALGGVAEGLCVKRLGVAAVALGCTAAPPFHLPSGRVVSRPPLRWWTSRPPGKERRGLVALPGKNGGGLGTVPRLLMEPTKQWTETRPFESRNMPNSSIARLSTQEALLAAVQPCSAGTARCVAPRHRHLTVASSASRRPRTGRMRIKHTGAG